MLTWLYELLMSFVTMILGFFGMDVKKKTVTFADEAEQSATETKSEEQPAEQTAE
jgi:hypothetical protein